MNSFETDMRKVFPEKWIDNYGSENYLLSIIKDNGKTLIAFKTYLNPEHCLYKLQEISLVRGWNETVRTNNRNGSVV